jgi:alpha-beta hydrolase superfamily lysophospholipase
VYPRGVPSPEAISFRAGEATLAGELMLPQGPPLADRRGRYPWVLLIGSWLPRDEDGAYDDRGHPAWFGSGPTAPRRPGLLVRLAEALARQGVASFRYATRGCADSGGDWASSDLFTRIDDARDALGAMRGRRELDIARSGVLGHGEGALIGLSVAIADPAIGALTTVGAPARSLRDLLRRGAALRTQSGEEHEHPFIAALDGVAEELIERADRREPSVNLRLNGLGEEAELQLAGWEQAFHTPGLALATMLHRSVTLAQGERDTWAGMDEAELLADTLRVAGNQPRTLAVQGAGHDLHEAADGVIEEIARDLAERLVPRELPPVLVALQELGEDAG